MEKHTVQQEILLVTRSKFSRQHWCEMDNTENFKHLSPAEQLEQACWNGMLDQIVPGLLEKSSSGGKLFICNICKMEGSLQIALSESTMLLKKEYSLDPHFFIPWLLATS